LAIKLKRVFMKNLENKTLKAIKFNAPRLWYKDNTLEYESKNYERDRISKIDVFWKLKSVTLTIYYSDDTSEYTKFDAVKDLKNFMNSIEFGKTGHIMKTIFGRV